MTFGKRKLMLTISEVNARLLQEVTRWSGVSTVNAWAADAAVKAARRQLAEYAKVNSRVADMLKEVLPQGDDLNRLSADAVAPLVDPDTGAELPPDAFVDMEKRLHGFDPVMRQKHIDHLDTVYPGFAEWIAKRPVTGAG